MIAANELRIGITLNILKPEVSGFNPVTIDKDRLIALLKGEETTYYPIPLTAEILKQCGWIWNEECKSYEKYRDTRMNLQYHPVNGSYTMFNYILGALIANRIYYLHQLQNLYFVLHGKELE